MEKNDIYNWIDDLRKVCKGGIVWDAEYLKAIKDISEGVNDIGRYIGQSKDEKAIRHIAGANFLVLQPQHLSEQDPLHNAFVEYNHAMVHIQKLIINCLTICRKHGLTPITTRGRKKMEFEDYIITDNKQSTLNKLHSLIDGKAGKAVAIVIRAAIDEKLIKTPEFSAVQKEFGKIGSRQNFTEYLNKQYKYKNDLEAIKDKL
jgi:hypothetical protein